MKKLLYLLLPILVTSCGLLWEYRQIEEIDQMIWMKTDTKTFTADISNPGNYDVIILFRHVQGFPYADVAINMGVSGPGMDREDVYTIPVIGEDRQYLGEGSVDIWDIEYTALPAQAFESGEYTFTLAHEMAKDELELVMEVGIMLKKKN